MKRIAVLVFLFNGKNYIPLIEQEYRNQIIDDCQLSLKFILTDTSDGSKEYLKEHSLDFALVSQKDFNHAVTREKYILESNADIVILLTQDCRLVNNDTYQKLSDTIQGNVKFAYLRQVNNNRSVERYTRMFNYPKKSRIKSKKDIKELGLSTFFASDACSAIDVAFFRSIGGYGKSLPTNEDMYYAYKVISNNMEVAYVAETYVIHSHKFTLKQTEDRYFLFGEFLGMCPEFDSYSATDSGLKLAFKVILRILLEINIPALFSFIPNMLARLKGKKRGFQKGLSERKSNP